MPEDRANGGIHEQLRRIILLHFALIAFRIHFWKRPKTNIFMVLGLGGRGHDSQHQYFFISLGTPGHPN